MEKIKRKQTVGEEIANTTSHGVMAIFAIFALVFLILKSSNGWSLLASIIFGLTMFLLYMSSTLYHALSFTNAKGVFKRFDHIGIYLLIGGSFAPAWLLLPVLRETTFFNIPGALDTGLSFFIIQWVLIAVGVIFKSIWVYRFKYIHLMVYLLLGWSSLMFVYELYQYAIGAFWFILAGGISYSLGVIFYVLSRIKYFHFVWHLFVGLGTILQFCAIYTYLIY